VCRSVTDACDAVEYCTGTDIDCPRDVRNTCSACGTKFYDFDLDQSFDEGDETIPGWKIILGSTSVQQMTYTDQDGNFMFSNLPAGEYRVCEAYAIETNWLQTAPAARCHEFEVPSKEAESCLLDFGNICLGEGGGWSMGTWSSKRGRNTFLGADQGLMALRILRELNLVDASGVAFNPTTYEQFRRWILGANARNMAYMLSAQLAATVLTVRFAYLDAGQLVYAPELPLSNELGFVSLASVIDASNRELLVHPLSWRQSPFRAYQDKLQKVLDGANSNKNFLQEEACPFRFDRPSYRLMTKSAK
jgi:hypothetical protein